MKKAIHTRPVTVCVSETDYQRIKEITDEREISVAKWFRDAAKLQLEQEPCK